MSEELIYIWGRFICRVFGIETVSCRGRKACSVKHGHERESSDQKATPTAESSAERNARVREEAANAQSLAANLVGTCECHCHSTDKHCETCCQRKLCADCIYYSIGG